MVFAVLMIVATPVFAQGTTAGRRLDGLQNPGSGARHGHRGDDGVGQGKAIRWRNRSDGCRKSRQHLAAIRTALIIGLALIESLALYMFVLCISKAVVFEVF